MQCYPLFARSYIDNLESRSLWLPHLIVKFLVKRYPALGHSCPYASPRVPSTRYLDGYILKTPAPGMARSIACPSGPIICGQTWRRKVRRYPETSQGMDAVTNPYVTDKTHQIGDIKEIGIGLLSVCYLSPQ